MESANPDAVVRGSEAAFVMGIIGILIPYVGVGGIIAGNRALGRLASNPGLAGERHARLGRLLGLIGTIAWTVFGIVYTVLIIVAFSGSDHAA